MLDDTLDLRLTTFATVGGIDPAVVQVVREELERLPGERHTDEALGMFTSHLVNALDRAVRGTALTAYDAQDVVDAVVEEHPEAYARAGELARRAGAALGADLPDVEVRILTLHLATIRPRGHDR